MAKVIEVNGIYYIESKVNKQGYKCKKCENCAFYEHSICILPKEYKNIEYLYGEEFVFCPLASVKKRGIVFKKLKGGV